MSGRNTLVTTTLRPCTDYVYRNEWMGRLYYNVRVRSVHLFSAVRYTEISFTITISTNNGRSGDVEDQYKRLNSRGRGTGKTRI